MKKGLLLLALSVATLFSMAQSIISYPQTNQVSIALGESGVAGSPKSAAQFAVILNSSVSLTTTGNELWLFIRVPKSAVTEITDVTIVDQALSSTGVTGFFATGSVMYYAGMSSSTTHHYLRFVSAPGINLSYLTTGQWKWAFTFQVTTPTALTQAQLAQFDILEESENADYMTHLINDMGFSPDAYYSRLMIGSSAAGTEKNLLSSGLNILPSTFLDFNVSKQGTTGALVSWTTVNESNVSNFAVQRSFASNRGWETVGQVAAKGNTTAATSYSYADANINFGNASSKVVYYRIVSVDNDAREKVSPIRSLQFTANNGKGITLYPNPAREGFYVTVPVLNPQDKKIRMNLVSQAGQMVSTRDISAAAANNYFFDLNTTGIVSGEYMLQIVLDGQILDTKKIMVQR